MKREIIIKHGFWAKRGHLQMMALVIAMMMMLTMISTAFASETPSGAMTLDTSISVTGLQTGDTVSFYKVLAYDQTANTTGGWALADGFTTLSADNVKQILALGDYAAGGSKENEAGINATLAGTIGTLASGAVAKYPNVTATATGASVANPEAGLYVAIITPAAGTDNTYNPVFVGADYYRENPETNTWEVTASMSYADSTMAKKSSVTLEKTAVDTTGSNDTNNKETVAVGDTITFTVTTTIPGFAANYTTPVFKLTDKLSEGLTLDLSSVQVTVPAGLSKGTGEDDEYNVTATKASEAEDAAVDGYVLAFTADYLKTCKTATSVTVTYTAVVNSDAIESVNPEDNTVTLNYSTNPSDTEGHGVKRDKTNHYSFDIDANLFGEENYEATEVVKVGVDKNGNEITETKQLSNEHWVGALENAEFKLYKDTNEAKGAAYTNKYYTADSVFVSDANGTLKLKDSDIQGIRGLDAGVYWLEETKAPEGYIKLQNAVKIEIKTVVQEKTYTETIDGVNVTYKADELVSYSVEIGGVETANYTMVNAESGTHPHIKASKGDTVVGGTDSSEGHPSTDASGKLKNTQGVELPSTGGMGTTIFYAIGAILVIGAGIVLITRRRMSVQ